MVRNPYILICISFTVLLSGCRGGPAFEVESRWSDEAVAINGVADDWVGYPLVYSEEEQISLGVRNDGENVYFIFLSRDEQLAQRVLMGGMALWFDPAGGKKKEFGVRYRGGEPLLEGVRAEPDMSEMMVQDAKAGFQRGESEMLAMITVVEGGEETPLPQDNHVGPQAASAREDGIFGYEFSIPIATNDSIRYALDVSPDEVLGICLELRGIDREARERMMKDREEMTDPPGGGMGGGGKRPMERGGGHGGGPPGSRREEREEMMKSKEVWGIVHLAQAPPVGNEGR